MKLRFLAQVAVSVASRAVKNLIAVEHPENNPPHSYFPSKLNRWATDTLKRFAIFSEVSNEGGFLPRSMRLRKSTEISSISANLS